MSDAFCTKEEAHLFLDTRLVAESAKLWVEISVDRHGSGQVVSAIAGITPAVRGGETEKMVGTRRSGLHETSAVERGAVVRRTR